jgi:hypothetical protein
MGLDVGERHLRSHFLPGYFGVLAGQRCLGAWGDDLDKSGDLGNGYCHCSQCRANVAAACRPKVGEELGKDLSLSSCPEAFLKRRVGAT